MKLRFLFFLCVSYCLQAYSQPVIQSFSPDSGPVGTIVRVKGTGFSNNPAHNIVYFGAVQAVINASTDTLLTVTVPVGATYAPVTVTSNNLTAYANRPFTLTFNNNGGSFDANSFLPKKNINVGIYPHGLSLADFTLDGIMDLLVSRGSSNAVTVIPNESTPGKIAFGLIDNYGATGYNHEGSATGDLDGDGKLDFVITNSTGLNSISIYRNSTMSNILVFPTKVDLPADNAPYHLAIGDLDGDGKPEIVAGNGGSGVISIYKNTSTSGNITFLPKVDLPVGTNTFGIAINDLDGDGKSDLAITCQGASSGLYIMRNTSSGSISFDAPVNYAPNTGFFTVTTGDLDGDGKAEVAAANAFSYGIIILKNLSTPGTMSFNAPEVISTGAYPVCVSIADVDGDGRPDLISANRMGNNVSLLKNKSTVAQLSFHPAVNYAVDSDPMYVTAGDLDGDHKPEIVVANSASSTVSILYNMVAANVAPAIDSITPFSAIKGKQIHISGSNFTGATSVTFGGIAASSFSVDSATGITAVVGEGASGEVSVSTQYGTAKLPGFQFNGPLIHSFTPSVGVSGTIITITGVNFTGATSVAFGGIPAAAFAVNSPTLITATVAGGSSGNVTVTTPSGTATRAGFSFGTPTISSYSPVSAVPGAVVSISGSNFSTTPSGNSVFFGAVKATVLSATSTQLQVVVPAGATYEPISVTVNNLTAHSLLPFLATFLSDSSNISTTSFAPAVNYATGTFPCAAGIKDFDGDGKPDLAIVNGTADKITILKNAGSPGHILFTTRLDLSAGLTPRRIAFGDLDGDNKPDIVVSNFNSGQTSTISVFRNTSTQGNIAFTPQQSYISGNGSIGLAIADMNGDGKLDIIVASGNSGYFSIFKNATIAPGAIQLDAKQDFTLMTHPDITVADIDGDGRPDVVTSDFDNGSFSIFRNISTGGNLALASRFMYSTSQMPVHINTADLNNDGTLDILQGLFTNREVGIFRNESGIGSLSFRVSGSHPLFTTSAAFGDLNGDGKVDILFGRVQQGIISVLQSTLPTVRVISYMNAIDFQTGNYDTYVAVGDLDGDLKPDLVATNSLQQNVSILRNTLGEPVISGLSVSQGTTGTVVTISGTNLQDATSVTFGDAPASSFTVVSPTRIDAVVGRGASGSVKILTGHGTATGTTFSFAPGINVEGSTTFCNGGSVKLSSSAEANNQWYRNGGEISGATDSIYIATVSGLYTVKTRSNSITTSSEGTNVTVVSIPTPVISIGAGNTLTSSAGSGNQWYFNGNEINGATSQDFQLKDTGLYTVRVTVDGCTSNFSAAYRFNPGDGEVFKLFPNPVKDKLYISWNVNVAPFVHVEIADLQGTDMVMLRNLYPGMEIDVKQFPPGIFLVKIYRNERELIQTLRIMKY